MNAAPINVQRLAALDLAGRTGQVGRRARLIRLEFVASAVLGLTLGAWLLAAGAPAWLGVWGLGIGVNYVALAAHAIDFLRYPEHLHAELRDVDRQSELRRYSATQLLLVVPFLIAGAAVRQHVARTRVTRGPQDEKTMKREARISGTASERIDRTGSP